MKYGYGYFAGVTVNYTSKLISFKLFARAIAQAKVLRWTWTIVDAKILCEKTSDDLVRMNQYRTVGSTVYVDYSPEKNFSASVCIYRPLLKFSTEQYRLGRWSYPIFLYVATLTFYVEPHITFHFDSSGEICTGEDKPLHLALEIRPNISFAVEAGVTGNLLVRSQ